MQKDQVSKIVIESFSTFSINTAFGILVLFYRLFEIS
jgi:hypothetical protein